MNIDNFASGNSVCFTGHRSLPVRETHGIIMATDDYIGKLYEHGYRNFIAGGAIGFDTLAACRVLVAKRKMPDIKLILALPCRNQTEKWTSAKDLQMYKFLLGSADEVMYVSQFYEHGCMHKRNRWMVDHSSVVIAYCTAMTGGTASTVKYATDKGRVIINTAAKAHAEA